MHQTLRWLVTNLAPCPTDSAFLKAAEQLPAAAVIKASSSANRTTSAGVEDQQADAQEQETDEMSQGDDDSWDPAPAEVVVQEAVIHCLLRVRFHIL